MASYEISVTVNVPRDPGNSITDRYNREGELGALMKLIAEIDNVHHRAMEFVKAYRQSEDKRLRTWELTAQAIAEKLDAVVSLHRNSQLETFLSFGLLFKFELPNSEVYEIQLTCTTR